MGDVKYGSSSTGGGGAGSMLGEAIDAAWLGEE